jgi:hypothetical protein
MAYGQYDNGGESLTLESKKFRGLFTREALMGSDYYKSRLARQQQHDIAHWKGRAEYLRAFIGKAHNRKDVTVLKLKDRLAHAEKMHAEAVKPGYLATLEGTLGLDAVS